MIFCSSRERNLKTPKPIKMRTDLLDFLKFKSKLYSNIIFDKAFIPKHLRLCSCVIKLQLTYFNILPPVYSKKPIVYSHMLAILPRN